MLNYDEMTPAQQIEHDYGGTQLTDDVNHHRRRFFRCWLDGSYNGESHYRANCEVVRNNYHSWSKLREFVLSEFVDYTAKEYETSRQTASDAISSSMTSSRLIILLDALVDDARDLVDFEEE
tara:strand:+ start:2459 stop:2824 length:366 start_codon:yes stop_codon:yes gene_type:complete